MSCDFVIKSTFRYTIMTWSNLEVNNLVRKQLTRFLIDGQLGPGLGEVLKSLGHDARRTLERHLEGRSDEEVLAAARLDERIWITERRDFLDERRFPRGRHAGVVVIPPAKDDSLTTVLAHALSLISNGMFWAGVQIVVRDDGRFTVTRHNRDIGIWETTRYKLRKAGPPLIWQETTCVRI